MRDYVKIVFATQWIDTANTKRSLANLTSSSNTGDILNRIDKRHDGFIVVITSVADPYHFDADPDPRIRFRDDGSGFGL